MSTASNGFHSYASRIGSKKILKDIEVENDLVKSFHSYASRIGSKSTPDLYINLRVSVSIHTLHELEARRRDTSFPLPLPPHPSVSIHTLHELEARNLEQRTVKYKCVKVSIHTLHELEASLSIPLREFGRLGFPFIRFTNWKQD